MGWDDVCVVFVFGVWGSRRGWDNVCVCVVVVEGSRACWWWWFAVVGGARWGWDNVCVGLFVLVWLLRGGF